MGHGVDQLRAGTDRHAAASRACAVVREHLTAHSIAPAMAGDVPAAAAFGVAVAHVLARQAADAVGEAVRRIDLSERAAHTAGLGVQLISDTTAASLSGTG
jgi:hypothetical protein